MAYEQMLARGTVEPIPEIVDENRFKFRLAKKFGCSVLDVDTYPLHYIAAARVDLEVERIRYERQKEHAESQRRRSAAPRTRRR